MHILSLYLRNFRNYEEAFFTFSPGVNLIIGENGAGKTNLVEALYFLITGRSFRAAHLAELILFGKEAFYLEAQFIKNGVTQTLKIYATAKERKVFLNATQLPTISALFGIVPGVLLAPQDLELIRGPPSIRRDFLNLHIAKYSPLYLYHLTRYLRAMKQRNALLKQREVRGIEAWEEEMAKAAEFITVERERAIISLHKKAAKLQLFVSGDQDQLSLYYKAAPLSKRPLSITEFYINEWNRLKVKELDLGVTLSGPHKDDMKVELAGREAKFYASEGQARTMALALRLSEWEQLKALREEVPILAIDDVGISLDREREEKLYSYMPNFGQVFLTSPKELVGNFYTIEISPSLTTCAHNSTQYTPEGRFQLKQST